MDDQAGSFECDVVMTRGAAGSSTTELSVFRNRFKYGPPGLKYFVFAEPVTVKQPWAGQ